MASVVGLFVASAIGQPMQTCTSVRAFAGRGLEGDRCERSEGSYSKLPRVAARHVSLIACEAIEAANRELVQRALMPFEVNETRRNIVVDGIDVYGLLGKEFRIGAVRLRGSEPTRPCHLPSAVTGKMGFAEASRSRRRAGRGSLGWNYFERRPHSNGLMERVCSWHFSEVPAAASNFRFQRKSRPRRFHDQRGMQCYCLFAE
jgi:hypothetical protein